MKRKWLIAIASLAMVVTLAFGFAACQPEENGGPSDEEIAQSGITTLNGIYLDSEGKVKDYETPDDYSVVSRVKVEDEFYAVSWSVSSDTENIAQYVSIATEADSSSQYTVDITRATFDIEYKLTASITVGKVTKTTSYSYKIPKKSSEEATTASISFATSENRTEFTDDIQVWKNKDGTLVFTNRKANSTSSMYYTDACVRLYQGSTIEIEFPGLTTVVFHSASNDPETYKNPKPFYDYLKSDLEAAFPNDTVTADDANSTLTLTLKTPVDFIEFTASKQLRLNSIDVEGTEGGASVQQKVASVKAWLTVSQTSFNSKTTVALATEKAGTTIVWSLKAASEYVKVENGTLTIENLPDSGEEQVILVATISAGATEKDTKEFTLTLTPEAKLENDGTAEHPYTVAEVYQLASTLASGSVYQKDGKSVSMHVKGIVTAEGKWNSDYSNWQNVLIADTASGTPTLKLYGLNPGAGLSETNGPKVGGTITVVGALKNYKDEIELTFDGSVKLNTVAYTAPVDERTPQEKVTAALKALATTFTVTGTGETDLPASTVDGVTFAWSTTDPTYPIANNKISVTALPAEDATVTATVTATCGTEAVTNNTKTVTITIRAEGSQPEIDYGTVEKPITVAQAIALANTIGGNDYLGGSSSPIQVVVKGIVIATGTFSSYGNWEDAYIADTADASSSDYTKAAQVYRLEPDGTFLKANGDLIVGATITIQGWLQSWNGKAEICHNKATNVNCKAVAYSTEGVTPPEPGEEVVLPAGDVTLDFSSVTEHGSEIAEGDATDYFKGFTQSADLTAASVSKKVYKGNGNGGGSYENAGGMLKLGTGSASATITLTFAKNVTKVVIMAQGWPGGSDTIAVNSETAQALSNSEKALYTFELSTPATEIAITTNNRAFIFGIVVTFEGGEDVEPEITGDLIYTLSTAVEQGSNSGYAGNCDIEVDGVTWNLEGNSQINPWRLGGKSSNCAAKDRKLTSKTTFGGTVKSLAITFGTANITVNSVTFNVYSTDPTESGAQTVYTQTVTFKANGTTIVAAPAGGGWENCYYQLVFNLTATRDDQNQYVQISKIEFYGDLPEHVHAYAYEHDEGAWTHTGTCSVPGCDRPTITEKCAPKLNRCEDCDYTYSEKEIVEQLYKLSSGQTMPGTYSLKGEVKSIDTKYDSTHQNVTFTITVEGKTVQCFREKSSYSNTVKVGDIVTVEGVLMCYGTSGTKEFNSNCKIVELEEPEVPEEQKPQELKIYDAFGNEIANGSTLEVPLKLGENSFNMRAHVHVLPDTAPQPNVSLMKVTSSDESKVRFRSGCLEVLNKAAVGDVIDLTFTVDDLETPTVIHVKIVEEDKYTSVHGMTKDDPLTPDELIDIIDKLYAIDARGAAFGSWNYFYVQGTLIDCYGSSISTHFIIETTNGTKIDIGSFSKGYEDAADITSWMKVQLGAEVVVAAPWVKKTSGDYPYAQEASGFSVYKWTPPTDETRLEYANKYVGDDFVKTTTYERCDIVQLPLSISYNIPVELSWKIVNDEHPELIKLDKVVGNGGATVYDVVRILALPKEDTTVTLELTITSGEKSITKNFTLTVKGNAENFGTKDVPLTLAEAIALGTKICVEADSWTPSPIYVKGLAEAALVDHGDGRYDDFNLVTDADAKILVSYLGVKEDAVMIYQNDELVICGFLKKLSDGTFTINSRSGSLFGSSIKPTLETVTAGKSTVTLAAEGATVSGLDATQQKTNGDTVSFTVSPKAGKQIVYVSVNGAFITAQDGNYSFKVEGDMAVVVKVAAEGETVALTASYDSTAQGYETGEVVESAKANDVDLTFSKGETGYDIKFAVRGYLTLNKDHTITVAVPETNYKITKITFKYYRGAPTMTAADGTLNEDCTVWTGSAQSVVFTVTSTSMTLVSIDIEYEYTVPAAAAAAEIALLPGKND